MLDKTYAFPQVLLLGNGLNLAGGAAKWPELIWKIKSNPKIQIDESIIEGIPYPLLTVLVTGDQVDSEIKKNPELFCGCDDKMLNKIRHFIQKLLEMEFDELLTTNYSYEIERTAYPRITQTGDNCVKLMRHTGGTKRAESKYLLHTYNEVKSSQKVSRVWHIHGETRKSCSIILGHYYYGNLLKQYQKFFDDRKNKQFENESKGRPPIMESWLDAFVMGDVYVLGFGFDFSEFDLWWLLNRKKREKASHGKVYFYEPTSGNEIKHMLLETYDVQIECLGYRQSNPDYTSFYQAAITDIRKRIESNRAKE